MTFEFNFVLVGLMQIVGFFVQGCTGFGCTVIAAAVTNGLLGTTEGVPYGTLITLPFLYFLGIKAFKEVSWKDLAKIIVLCMPGILVGNYLFHAISPVVAKICIGGMVTFIALMNIYKHIIKPLVLKKNEEEEADTTFKKVLRYGCLILGGVVHGAFNIGGPLITWNPFSQFRSGVVTPHLWSALAVGAPMAAVGFFVGMAFLKKINKETFLRIVYCVLLFVGANMLITSLLAL